MIHPIPDHQILDLPGKRNIYRQPKPKRLKPGPSAWVPANKRRDRCIASSFNDEDVEAIDAFRKAMQIPPTRSSFIVYVVRKYIEENRRRDVPGIHPKR